MLFLLLACTKSPAPDDTGAAIDAVLETLLLPDYLLVPADGSGELPVVALDQDGLAMDVDVTWVIEDSSVVQVDEGAVTPSGTISSTLVHVEADGVVSNPTLVYVAKLAPEAVVVPDDAVGALTVVDTDPQAVIGTQFEASIDADLAAGDLVTASGSALPLARVVSADDPMVLELVEIDVFFEELSVSGQVADYARDVDAPDVFLGFAAGKVAFGGMDCRLGGDISASALTVQRAELTVEHALRPTFDYQISGFSLYSAELLVEGQLGVEAAFQVEATEPVKGSVTCGAEKPAYAAFPLPPFLGGPLIQGYVPFYAGVQLELETEGLGPQVGVTFTGEIEATAGVRYIDGEWEDLSSFESDLELEPIFELPDDDNRVKASAWPFVSVGLGPGIPTVPRAKFYSLVEANVGPKLTADLAAAEYQVQDNDYASDLSLDLAWTVGPPQNVTDTVNGWLGAGSWLLGRLGGNLTGFLTYSDQTELWASPTGTLTLDDLGATGTVSGNVALDSEPGWVADALTVRSWDGTTLTELDRQALDETDVDVDWSASVTDTPQIYAAFLETTWLDIPLEIDVVDLGCQQVHFVVDDFIAPDAVEDDGVDVDQDLYTNYDTITILYTYYQAEADYWLSQYNYYTSVGQYSSAASAYSLWDYYQVVASNLATESIGAATVYAASANMDTGAVAFRGGVASDDYAGTLADMTFGVFEAGTTAETTVPDWESFPENSRSHQWLVAGESGGNYPLLAMWSWKVAQTLDGDLLVRMQDFTGIVVYLDDGVFTATLDGTEIWGGAAVTLTPDTEYTLVYSVSGLSYDRNNFPSLDRDGVIAGTLLSLTFHLEATGDACATE